MDKYLVRLSLKYNVGKSKDVFGRCRQHRCNGKISEIMTEEGSNFDPRNLTVLHIPMEGATKLERELVENAILKELKRSNIKANIMNKKEPVDSKSQYEVVINGVKFNRGEVGDKFYDKFDKEYKDEIQRLYNMVIGAMKGNERG